MTTATAGKETMHEQTQAVPSEAPVSSFAMLRTLGGIAAISGLLLALTYQATFNRIQHNKEEALRAAIFKVLPGADEQKPFEVNSDGTLTPLEGSGAGVEKVYAGYKDGKLVGVALEGSAQGYGDVIKALYGYDPETQKIVGFKVLESKETPGLGDRIMKEPFVDNFKELDVALDASGDALVHPVETVKNGKKEHPWQIDGVSGATISSKAVGRLLQESTNRLLPIVWKQLPVLRGEG